MTTPVVPLQFRIGARTLATMSRRLVRHALSLDAVLRAVADPSTMPALPVLPTDADGYSILSWPEARLADLTGHGLLVFVRQHYARYHTDLTTSEDRWLAGLSASARSGLKRKAKKLAAANGGALDIRSYHDEAAFSQFHVLARGVSAMTYQEKLLGSGLPDEPGEVRQLRVLAAADRLRAWLLFFENVPVAYLCCTEEDGALRYDYVGHDPACAELSPGAVLQVEAIRASFGHRFARFDFTEGEGQHKRQFATGGTPCVDVLLLRATLANRAVITALRTFDGMVATVKEAATHPMLKRLVDTIRR